MKRFVFVFLIFILVNSIAYAVEVDMRGEALIVNNDVPAAKSKAISRAKWMALENVADISVKIDTLIRNSTIADEAIKTELTAKVVDFKILDEGRDLDTYWVDIRVDIDNFDAEYNISTLAKNTSIVVVMPIIDINKKYQYNTEFSQKLIKELTILGFDVKDISQDLNDKDILDRINNAIMSENYNMLNFLTSKYFVQNILIGKLKIRERSKDVGYTKISFSIVDGSLDWRLIGHRGEGRRIVLTSGVYNERGQGSNSDAAMLNLYKNLANNTAYKLASDTAEKVLGVNNRTVTIILAGPKNIRNLYALRNDIQLLPFVLDVRESGTDTIIVTYPEKTYYLAAFLTGAGKYKLESITRNELIVSRM